MSKTRGIIFALLSLLVTRHSFKARGVRIVFCGLIPFTVDYDRICLCDTKVSHYRCLLSSAPIEETRHRVYIRTGPDFCIAIRPPEVAAFVQALRARAPHIHVRTLKESFREFPSAT